MLFATVLLLPLFFLKLKYIRLYLLIAYLIFAIIIVLESAFYCIFKANFSSSVIFVILDANFDEANEFVSFYLDKKIIILIIASIVITIYSLIKLSKLHFNFFESNKKNRIRAIILLVGIVLFLKLSTVIVYNLPYLALKSSLEYFKDSKELNYYRENKIGNFQNVSIPDLSEEEIYVIVIGESTTKNHMGLYGYYRETTPELSEINNELLIYDNVISPHTYTTASLTKALTLGNYENPKMRYQGSLIQLLNKAKFTTYWISNQKPVGAFDSQISSIGLGASTTKFLNIKNPDEKTNFDDILLEELNDILLVSEPKKIIFLHLLGTHMKYENRYPESFNYFTDSPKKSFEGDEVASFVNAYDNAVLYNDYILSVIIKSVKKIDKKSAVIYFSDHGEEVYNEIDFVGHSADQIITKNVYEIPFFIWVSDSFIFNNDFIYSRNRKYMSDDIFHSIADLLEIKTREVDSSRSIFSKFFNERKRVIQKSIDYDSLYSVSK